MIVMIRVLGPRGTGKTTLLDKLHEFLRREYLVGNLEMRELPNQEVPTEEMVFIIEPLNG